MNVCINTYTYQHTYIHTYIYSPFSFVLFLDPTNQQTVGTVVMLKDEVYGGVKTRTFMNFTLGKASVGFAVHRK